MPMCRPHLPRVPLWHRVTKNCITDLHFGCLPHSQRLHKFMGKKMRGFLIHYSMTMYNMECFRCVVEARENKWTIICISANMIVHGILWQLKKWNTQKGEVTLTSFANPKVDVSPCVHTVDSMKPEGNLLWYWHKPDQALSKSGSVSMERGGYLNLPLQIGHLRRGVTSRKINAKNVKSVLISDLSTLSSSKWT